MALRLLLISLAFSGIAAAGEDFVCTDNGKLRIQLGNEIQVVKSSYCTGHAEYDIISKNCLSESCQAYQKYQRTSDMPVHPHNSLQGNPFHRKCSVVGGTPLMISYWKDQWVDTAICQFGDGSFISVFNDFALRRK